MDSHLLKKLPDSKNSSLLVARKQTVEDIFELVKRGVRDSQAQAQLIAWYFVGADREETCYNIWKFLKANVTYQKETKDLQTVKTLSRLLKQDKVGDCKHFSTAVGSLLTQLKIPYVFRLVSFNYFDSTPTHIYVVAKVNGESIYIDCVLNEFNSEASYKSKTDKKCH